MSILRNGNVALSNLRNAPVTLSILRNDHVPCHYLFKAHVTCHYAPKRPMSPCQFQGSRAIRDHSRRSSQYTPLTLYINVLLTDYILARRVPKSMIHRDLQLSRARLTEKGFLSNCLFVFNCMFYQLLRVQHSCSSTQSWSSVLPSIVETRDQNSRGCPLLFSNRILGSFCA